MFCGFIRCVFIKVGSNETSGSNIVNFDKRIKKLCTFERWWREASEGPSVKP